MPQSGARFGGGAMTQAATKRLIDVAEIRRALTILIEPGQVIELRALNATTRQSPKYRYTASGYFNDVEALIKAAGDITSATGIYITLNPCKRGLITRACNRIRTADYMRIDKRTTSDGEILRYRWLPVDIDPVRQDGNDSSSDVEHDAALARHIHQTLQTDHWPSAVLADSGNGAHILYRMDLENTAESTDLIKRTLAQLDARFSTETAKVDTGIFNPARIMKLYGTRACKGDATPEWPHRMTSIIGGELA